MGYGQQPGEGQRRRDRYLNMSVSQLCTSVVCICFFKSGVLTNTGTTETDGSGTHAQVLGDLDEGVGHLRRVGALGLGGDLGAGGVHQGGGALHGVESGGLAGGGCVAHVSRAAHMLCVLVNVNGILPPEYARAKFWSWAVFIIGRATLTELCVAMEAILGAAMRREEAIAMVFV